MKPLDIIRNTDNNIMDDVALLLDNGYQVMSGLVYHQDYNTTVKYFNLSIDDPEEGVQRVNAIVPGYIQSYEVLGQMIKLSMHRYHGHTVKNVIRKKKDVTLILDKCFEMINKCHPYSMSDLNSSNILIRDNKIFFIDFDHVFEGRRSDVLSDYCFSCYQNMDWLHPHMTYQEFEKKWKENI